MTSEPSAFDCIKNDHLRSGIARVDLQLTNAIGYYRERIKRMRRLALALRRTTILCFVLGSLVPLIKLARLDIWILALIEGTLPTAGTPSLVPLELGYLFLGAGAILDRVATAVGPLKGWARYVVAQIQLQHLRATLDFAVTRYCTQAQDGSDSLIQDVDKMMRSGHQIIEQETERWAQAIAADLETLRGDLQRPPAR